MLAFVKLLISNQHALHTGWLFLMSSEKAVDWVIPTGIGLSIIQIGHSSGIDFLGFDAM